MDVYNKLPTYTHSIKQSFENNTPYQSLQTCLTASLVTNSSLNLIFPCNITHSNLTNLAKSIVSLSQPLANMNTNASPWDSNVLLTFPSKSWKRSYTMYMAPVFIWTIYWCFLLHLGTPHVTSWHNSTLTRSQWLHRQSTQMWMGYSGTWLAWLFAHTHWFEALVEKIDGILQMQKPINLLQMRGFLGAVNHF